MSQGYDFIRFEASNAKNKKYAAILRNRRTERINRVNFGDTRYEQYHDSTGLGIFSHLNHGDEKRRKAYHKRHSKIDNYSVKYTPAWFSRHYLW